MSKRLDFFKKCCLYCLKYSANSQRQFTFLLMWLRTLEYHSQVPGRLTRGQVAFQKLDDEVSCFRDVKATTTESKEVTIRLEAGLAQVRQSVRVTYWNCKMKVDYGLLYTSVRDCAWLQSRIDAKRKALHSVQQFSSTDDCTVRLFEVQLGKICFSTHVKS